MRQDTILNRKTIIPLLLAIYAALAVAALFVLPKRLGQEQPVGATISAPLELPEELKEQLTPDDEIDEVPGTPPMEDAQAPAADADSGPEPKPQEETEPPTGHIVTEHKGAAVHVRAQASLDAEITAKVYGGDAVLILSESEKWYEIQKDEITGFVYKKYVGE